MLRVDPSAVLVKRYAGRRRCRVLSPTSDKKGFRGKNRGRAAAKPY